MLIDDLLKSIKSVMAGIVSFEKLLGVVGEVLFVVQILLSIFREMQNIAPEGDLLPTLEALYAAREKKRKEKEEKEHGRRGRGDRVIEWMKRKALKVAAFAKIQLSSWSVHGILKVKVITTIINDAAQNSLLEPLQKLVDNLQTFGLEIKLTNVLALYDASSTIYNRDWVEKWFDIKPGEFKCEGGAVCDTQFCVFKEKTEGLYTLNAYLGIVAHTEDEITNKRAAFRFKVVYLALVKKIAKLAEEIVKPPATRIYTDIHSMMAHIAPLYRLGRMIKLADTLRVKHAKALWESRKEALNVEELAKIHERLDEAGKNNRKVNVLVPKFEMDFKLKTVVEWKELRVSEQEIFTELSKLYEDMRTYLKDRIHTSMRKVLAPTKKAKWVHHN
jgi:hypothetical protein